MKAYIYYECVASIVYAAMAYYRVTLLPKHYAAWQIAVTGWPTTNNTQW
jgi:hypothetical protein